MGRGALDDANDKALKLLFTTLKGRDGIISTTARQTRKGAVIVVYHKLTAAEIKAKPLSDIFDGFPVRYLKGRPKMS